MNYARGDHTISLLTNGSALVAGGYDSVNYLNSVQLCDLSRGLWTIISNMTSERSHHTASILTSGKILIAGGMDSSVFTSSSFLNTAELYDPSGGLWTTTGSMSINRAYHQASLLTNGEVLVSGGYNTIGLTGSELYNSSSGMWTVTYSMTYNRREHVAFVLANGKVLVAGGVDNSTVGCTSTSELYQP
jgi:N-acetylneuraminic acid mutarotase